MFKKVAFTMYPISDVAGARKFYEETREISSTARSAGWRSAWTPKATRS